MEDAPLLGVGAGDFVVGAGWKEGGAAGVGGGGGFVAAGVGAFEEVAHVFLVDAGAWCEGGFLRGGENR